MKALAFTIAITILFASQSFAQTYCNITEDEARTRDSTTWNILKARFNVGSQPKHWEDQEARFYTNTLSNSAPVGARPAIIAAATVWNVSAWQGDDDFSFVSSGTTGATARVKDGKNVISFQGWDDVGPDPPGVTFYIDWENNRRDRLKEVGTILNTRYYWAIGAQSNKLDVQSVMAHEFGHWFALAHLYEGDHPTELGCDEFIPCVMYHTIGTGQVRRNLTWIDDWGKWYIYSSGDVNMAPSVTPMEFAPALRDTALVLRTRLLGNYPNPFNPETWIPYELAGDSDVSITIYDSHGYLVRQLDMGQQVKGRYIDKEKAVYWDGKDDNGASVASGVYFYTLRSDNFSQTRRLVILK